MDANSIVIPDECALNPAIPGEEPRAFGSFAKLNKGLGVSLSEIVSSTAAEER